MKRGNKMIELVKTGSLPAISTDCAEGFSDRVQIKEFFAKAVKECKSKEFLADLTQLMDEKGLAYVSDAVEGLLLGTYETKRYPIVPGQEWKIELTGLPIEAENIVRETETLVEGIMWTRDMTNCPGNLLRPSAFAEEVKQLFSELSKEVNVEVEVIDADRMKELGMNAILGVGMSSAYKPCLCIIRYRGNEGDNRITGLAGKGVTCDSGGYCLKPGDSMKGIKGDMAGGAAVAGAIYALAKNRISVNVTGLIPMVENRISDGSLLPGDVITSYSGKTIEIVNTDAEGRLILADTVTYAVRNEHVDRILDIATLTGNVCASLGFGTAGMLCDNEEFFRDFERAFEKSGERYLRFPIYREYERMIESEIADIKNLGDKFAGSITAGLFIRSFAEQTPWIHLDIAGTAWVEPPVFEYQSKGASGAGLTTMYYLCAGDRK
jgi:leucyl aminopeptidase